jgi:hypothetical protein
MLTVTCKGCGLSASGPDILAAHAALVCGCCPLPHNHGAAAIATGVPCRPVRISAPMTLLRTA